MLGVIRGKHDLILVIFGLHKLFRGGGKMLDLILSGTVTYFFGFVTIFVLL
jgi:hypothetical protein